MDKRSDIGTGLAPAPVGPDERMDANEKESTPASASASSALLALRRQAKCELRQAVKQLQRRGMMNAAKWASELLCQIDINAPPSNAADLPTPTPTPTHAINTKNTADHRQTKNSNSANSTLAAARHPLNVDVPSGATSGISSRRQTISTQLFATPAHHAHSSAAATSSAAASSSVGGTPFPALPVSPISVRTPIPTPSVTRARPSNHAHMTDTNSPELNAAAELFPPPPMHTNASTLSPTAASASVSASTSSPSTAASGALYLPPQLEPNVYDEWDEITLARSYFDMKEYGRAAYVLRDIPLTGGMEERQPSYPLSLPAYPTTHSTSISISPYPSLLPLSSHPNSNSSVALFLRCYALYLDGERRKEEEMMEHGKGSNGGAGAGLLNHANHAIGSTGSGVGIDSASNHASMRNQIVNRELRGLQSLLSHVLRRDASSTCDDGSVLPSHPYACYLLDGHLWFLYGLVLRDLSLMTAARHALLISVELFPWNWSAWKVLNEVGIRDRKQLEELRTHVATRMEQSLGTAWMTYETWTQQMQEQHSHRRQSSSFSPPLSMVSHPYGVYMREFFYVDSLLNLQSNGEADVLDVLNQLCQLFPHSQHVRAATAMAYYNQRKYPEAQHLFELLQRLDPYRLDHMDTYSNILYVCDDKSALSHLAHHAHSIDKYRVQTCCIIGNYYSMRGEHERAILYFQRALTLNPQYLSAWTLMGHEYVEIRNTNMAIECYRKAIDINPLDYRAWYGLGQTYEILQMSHYSLYYFKKACEIKPYDPRMWCAMGENFENLANETRCSSRLDDAIACYLRAEANNDTEGMALSKLAKVYRRRGQTERAADYYQKLLRRHMADEAETLLDGGQKMEDATAAAAVPSISASVALDPSAVNPSTSSIAAALSRSNPTIRGAAATPTRHAPSPAPAPSTAAHALGGTGMVMGMAGAVHPDAIDSMLFLAEYYFKHHKAYAKAEAFCQRLMDGGGPAKDVAKSLLIEIRQSKLHQPAPHTATNTISMYDQPAAIMQQRLSTLGQEMESMRRVSGGAGVSVPQIDESMESSSSFFASP